MDHQTSFRVRYSETDQMGVVHHRNYLSWFEVGRSEWIRKHLHLSYCDVENGGFLLPVREVSLHYKLPARYEDLITVRTFIKSYNGIRLDFGYEVFHEEMGQLLVEGETKHVWTNKEWKPISLKKHWPKLHDVIKQYIKE